MWTTISTAAIAAFTLFFGKFKTYFIIAGAVIGLLLAIALTAFIVTHQLENRAATIQKQQDQIESLTAQTLALKAQNQAILRDRATVVKANKTLQSNLEAIRTKVRKQQDAVTKHDLDAIGAKHPKMLEDRINKATADSFSRLKDLTK
jgi:hypothetical protein